MNRPFAVLFLGLLLHAGCTRAPQTDAARKTTSGGKKTVVPATTAAAAKPNPTTEPQSERGLYGGEPIGAVPNELTSLAFDRDGILWIGSRYSGLIALKDCRFTLFDQYNSGLTDCGIHQILVDKKNTKWVIGGRGALFSFDNSQWKQIAPAESEFSAMREDPRGRIWCYDGGRLSFVEDGTIRQFLPKMSSADADLWDRRISAFDIDRHGTIWVAAEKATIFKVVGERATVVLRSPSELGWQARGIACDPNSDDVFIWGQSRGEPIWRLHDGRLTPLRTGSKGLFEPIRWFPDGTLAIQHELFHGVAMGKTGDDLRVLSEGTPLANETVTDVAIEKPGRTWFAGRFAGLQLLDDGKWTSCPQGVYLSRPRLEWERKPIEDLINQEAVDVDMQQVIKNPRQYANKKLRFKGRSASSFEYMNMSDSRGADLHIWPGWAGELEGYLATVTPRKPLGDRGSFDDTRITELTEYLGFLEWGGYFGHMGGWSMEFTVVEEYPADATPEKKAAMKQAYLKSIPITTAPWPISDLRETQQTRDARQALAGAWKLTRAVRSGRSYVVPEGPDWIFSDSEVVEVSDLDRRWGTYRVDASREPSRIDIGWNNWVKPNGVDWKMGIYRLDEDELTIRWPDRNARRPASFSAEMTEDSNLVELVRDPHATIPPPDPNESAADDPKVVAELTKADAAMDRDNRGHVVGIHFRNTQAPEAPKQIDRYVEGLSRLPHLEHLSIFVAQISDVGLAGLEGCNRLTSLEFMDRQGITDAGLKHLAGLSRLRSLGLYDQNVSDAGIEQLAHLTALEWLGLSKTRVTGAALRHLENCSKLQSICLDDTQVTDAGLEVLAKFLQLQTLSLQDTKITDASLSPLAGLTKMRYLHLGNTKISDAGIAHLSELTELRDLDLSGTKLTDAGAVHLRGLTKLRSLNLSDTRVTGAGLRDFADCKDLDSLNLDRDQITAADLAFLRSFPNLRWLQINGIPIDDATIKTLDELPKLESIYLSDPPVSRKLAQALADARPKLSVQFSAGTNSEWLKAKQH